MDKIVITGGKRLQGEVAIGGAKNAALPILASTLLSSGEYHIRRVPKLMDVTTIRRLLTQLGAKIFDEGDGLAVEMNHVTSCEAPYELVKTMRASVLVLGPLAARMGEAHVSLPGGCAIGARPVNLHLDGLEKMGAEVKIEHGYVRVKAKRLKGATIHLDMPTVTGTENLMMAATLAEGTTRIENAACEPEVVDLARFLEKRGAKITGAGTSAITIEGTEKLNGADYEVMPDRIEAGTYLAAGAVTGGDVLVSGCAPSYLDAVLLKLREAGVKLKEDAKGIRVWGPKRLKAVDVKTLPYPGFPTDMQAQMMAVMSFASGLSVITETVFEGRFGHVAELRRMGADIRVQGSQAVVQGVPGLTGAPVMASDLRASASLIIAGLAAEGTTEISRVYHLDRGYERIEEKLGQLGVTVSRRKE
ncbi:MAG TPA: UDP-N-acetylglucosamine 1-carboxyvinyltransferase [Nitrospiria bacterium]|jgi:UDP-N-acetylglucosamine 1-carboxyvinyltransferase|nr:UDP-N-acetylglucosamine 1-carboxyvinyltransferase [Nitrospiria bacterium]